MTAYDVYNYFVDNIKYAAVLVGTLYVIMVVFRIGFDLKNRRKR